MHGRKKDGSPTQTPGTTQHQAAPKLHTRQLPSGASRGDSSASSRPRGAPITQDHGDTMPRRWKEGSAGRPPSASAVASSAAAHAANGAATSHLSRRP